MQDKLLRLNLQFFSDEESTSWDEYLSEQVESISVDDQPEVESEEHQEEVEDTIEHEVEPNDSEQTDESEEEVEEDNEEDAHTELSDDTEISLGEDKQPVTLSELKQGYLRQSDYTKKTQALSEERKEIESLQEEIKPVQAWLNEWAENPYLVEQITQAIQSWKSTGVLPLEQVLNDPGAKYINHLMRENKQLKQQLEDTETNYQSTKFESEFASLTHQLQADYGELANDEYLNELRTQASEQGLSIDVLKRIADGDLAKKQLEQEKQNSKTAVAKAKQKQKSKRLPPQPSQKGQKPAKADPTDVDTDSWVDFLKVASQ
jgi:hypothetical protein